MKLIKLTHKVSSLKKEVEDKIKGANNVSIPKDSSGLTKEWYEDMGLPVPEELSGNTYETIESIVVTKDDFDYKFKDCYIDIVDISILADFYDEGCEITTKNGDVLNVKETSEEVYNKITELNK